MRGSGRQRHCGHCDQEVVNLSRMTEAEAESFLEANHAPCVRYHLSVDGEFLFQTQLERQRRGAETPVRTATMLVPLVVAAASRRLPDASAYVADPPDLYDLTDALNEGSPVERTVTVEVPEDPDAFFGRTGELDWEVRLEVEVRQAGEVTETEPLSVDHRALREGSGRINGRWPDGSDEQ